MTPLFKFTLTWAPLSGSSPVVFEVSSTEEPRGWKESKLSLERHDKYHSLIEYFEAPLEFYGTPLKFILDAESTDGIRANVTVDSQIQFDREIGFEALFSGKLDVGGIEDRNKSNLKFIAKLPIIRNDLWAMFISRTDTEVNVQSDTDLYGNSVTILTPKTLNLKTQKIRQNYSGKQTDDLTRTFTIPDGQYVSLDFTNETIDQIQTKYSLGIDVSPDLPSWKFDLKYGGSYITSAVMVFYQGSFIGSSALDNAIKVKIQINDDAPIDFTKTDITSGIDHWSVYEYFDILNLDPRDRIRVYMKNETGTTQIVNWYANIIQDSHLTLVADTIYPDSTSDALLLHDLGYSILDRITTPGSFYSPFLGHTSYTAIAYDEIGCGFPYITLLGLHARGYDFSSKILSISFTTWFDSTSAILNLGLGYKVVDDVERIIIDKKESFYDSSDRSVVLFNVPDIIRTYDLASVVKDIKIGYKSWEASEDGVIDDPQTKSTYSTVFETVGQSLDIESDFVANGQTLEVTRRKAIIPNSDWEYDNKVFIVAINRETGPTDFDPEMDENFVSNSLNPGPGFRYNLRLWPVYNLLRWMNVIVGGLEKYPLSVLKFNGGEGNYSAFSEMDIDSDCLLTTEQIIACNQDIPANIGTQRNKPLHGIELFSFKIPMSWEMYKAIRAKKDNAIGIGYNGDGAVFDFTFDFTFLSEDVQIEDYFIKKLSWGIYNGAAELEVWKDVPALPDSGTTTTTTTTTTTSTTSAPGRFDIENNSTNDLQINSVKVNGIDITVTSGSFPVGPGQTLAGNSFEYGILLDIEVNVTVTTPNNNITISDPGGICFDVLGDGDVGGPLFFNAPGNLLTVIASDGPC